MWKEPASDRVAHRAPLRLVMLLWCLPLGLSLSCASARSEPRTFDEFRDMLRARGVEPSYIVIPFEVDDAIRSFLEPERTSKLPDRDRLLSLQERLTAAEGMEVTYRWDQTGTAIEVFRTREANCLAFTNLFVGMARELGIQVYFVAVENREGFRRDGDLVVVSDHVAVAFGIGDHVLLFDFAERPRREGLRVRRLADVTAIAMFYSNRGVEELRRGGSVEALRWLRAAVAADPELSTGWINLGVARRRAGDPAGAENAYRKAIEVDPEAFSAYHNLASLLRGQERNEEAEAYEQALASLPSRNPYTYLGLGDISLAQGRQEEAERLYRRAIRLDPEGAEAPAALGKLAYRGGRLRLARKMLERARQAEPGAPRTRELACLLEGDCG